MNRRLTTFSIALFTRLALAVMILQNLLPLGSLLVTPSLAIAADETPTPAEETVVPVSTPESEVVENTPTPEPTVESETVPAPEIIPEPEPVSPESSSEEQPLPAPAPTPVLVEAPVAEEPQDEIDPMWSVEGKTATVAVVELDKTYTAPQNDQVKLMFTQLPEIAGSVTIEEVELTDEQVAALGAYSNVAYDITSTMENGSFAYDLELPLPNEAPETAQVVYAENTEALIANAAAVNEEKVTIESGVVTVTELDHFTIFVVTSFEEVQTTPVNVGYNTSWFGAGGSTITQVPTGTNGITSSEGNNHAEITGYAFTRWDGYKNVFPTGGYDTRVDVYVDTSLADGSTDQRLNYSSAISNTSSGHRRDFIFHLGTNPTVAGQWLASVSNNSPGWPGDPARSPIAITDSGWYTLEHQFRDVSGVLEVTLNIYKKGEATPVGTWVLSDPSDIIGSTVGGNRYGWFVGNATAEFGFDWLAIDAAKIEYDSLPMHEHSVVVRPSSLHGWTPATTVGGQVDFINYGSAPLGDGVLSLTTQSDVQDRASVARSEDVLLSDIYTLGYKTNRPSGFQAEGNASYRILIDADGNSATTTDQAYLIHEPYWQNGGLGDAAPVAYNVWQSWDVTPGIFWASIPGGNSVSGLTNGAGGPPFYSLQDVINLHPNAKVIGLNIGIGSYNLNYDIAVDAVLFGYKTDSSIELYTYDFESALPPVVSIDPTTTQLADGVACGVGSALAGDGLTVNVTNWQDGFVLQGRYFTAGGSFGGWFDLSPWGTFTYSGDDATFFANNSGDSPAGPAGWEVRVVDASSAVVSNVDAFTYIISTDPTSAACGGMEVALCKEDVNGNPLPGWKLLLSGRELIDEQLLNSNSATGISFNPPSSGYYQLVANGTWNNGSHEQRDALYGASGINEGNLNPINTGTYDDRIVKLVVNDAPGNLLDFQSMWGVYNPAHEYASVLESDGSPLAVRVWDFPIGSSTTSWYGDNSGSLNVGLYELTDTHVVETGEDGCGYVEGIGSGEYYLSELPQTGWQYVEGAGEVTVSDNNTQFTIVNQSLLPEPETQLAQVTVCKEDPSEARLPGWQVLLYNPSALQSTVVPSNGTAASLTDVGAGDYVLLANGFYTYRGTAGAEYSDAGWSKRLPSDPVYIAGPFAPWVNVNTFGAPYTGYLGVMVDGDANWGEYFNPAHSYARSLAGYAGGTLSLQILDDNYGDNVGGVTVGLHTGYTGVTGENGCITFDDVPYGDYYLDEIGQGGWENVSGLGEKAVEDEEITFTIVNSNEDIGGPEPTATPTPTPSVEPAPTPTATPEPAVLSAAKVVCDDESYLPNNSFGGTFGPTTAADFVASSEGHCELNDDWTFQWAPAGAGSFGDFQVNTSVLDAPWTTFQAGEEVLFSELASLGGRIEVREVFPIEGNYVPFSNDSNVSAELWCSGDGANYDNWEWINNPQYGETYYCVAFNAEAEVDDPEVSPTPTPSPSAEPTPTPEPTSEPTPTPSTPSVLGASTTSSSKASPPNCSEFIPDVPLTLSAVVTGGTVALSWNDIPQADTYVLRVLPPDGSEYGLQGISGDVNSLTLTNLVLGTYTFELWGQDGCHPSPRAGATATIITGAPAPGEGAGGPIAELPGGEAVPLTEGEVQGAEDELTEAEIAALADGQVAGIMDENCELGITPWLPLIFLLVMGILALLVETIMRNPSLIKIAVLAVITGGGIALFYWLANCNCEQGGETLTQILSWLCKWFWIAAIVEGLLLRGVGFSFIQSEED